MISVWCYWNVLYCSSRTQITTDAFKFWGEAFYQIGSFNNGSSKILLEHKADVDIMDKFGKTSLMFAVDRKYQDEKLVRLLLKYNANCNLESHDGMRAVDYARQVDPKSKIIPLINTFLSEV